jgi:hypothetical protein
MVVSGKSTMSYFAAHANERKETRQLHTRFPKQLKKAVLTAVQFRQSFRSFVQYAHADEQRWKGNWKHLLIKSTSDSKTDSLTTRVRLWPYVP